MVSYCFTKYATTEPEFPRVLKLTAPKLQFSTAFKIVDCKKCFIFRLLTCTNAETKKGEKFRTGCDTYPYQP